MAGAKPKTRRRRVDPLQEAVIDYFAGRSHDAWRRRLLQTNPEQKGRPRMRLRGGVMVDVNQPWRKLHPKAQKENRIAARDAYRALKLFPRDREAAADYVHRAWIKRNKADKSQPKSLFAPYSRLPEIEKDKDRAHVDNMRKAMQAVGTKALKKAPGRATLPSRKANGKAAPGAAFKSVRISASQWRRLEAAAAQVSARVGRRVPATTLLQAGLEAALALSARLGAES